MALHVYIYTVYGAIYCIWCLINRKPFLGNCANFIMDPEHSCVSNKVLASVFLSGDLF